jgi:competence protein ComEC
VLADRGLMRLDAAVVLGAGGLALAVAWPRPRGVLALVVACAAGAAALGVQLEGAARFRAPQARELDLEGTVRDVARSAGGWRVELDGVVAIGGSGPSPGRRVRLYGRPTPPGVAPFEAALPGQRIRARVRLRPPASLRNPGARDRGREARRAGVGAVGRLVHPALHVRLAERRGPGLRASGQRLRARLAQRLAAAGPGGALLQALALGERGGFSSAQRDAFARLGIAHLLAVSGLHLALVASLAYAAARFACGRSAWIAARWDARAASLAVGCLTAAGYAWLAGWGIPVRRALVLLVALALSFARRRPGPRLAPLWVAALCILAVEPGALFAPGPQLSFAACAALLLAARAPTPTRRGRGAGWRRALGSSALALAATAPLAAAQLGARAPFALLVNAVAVPWTGAVLLPAALAATLAAGVEGAAPRAILALAERLGAMSLTAVGSAAQLLPGAVGRAAPAPAWLALCTALGLLALAARRTALRLLWAAAISALLWRAAPARLPPPPPRAVFFEVGQGDAALVQGRRGAVLVDAGVTVPGGPDLGRSAVVPALHALGVQRLGLVVASHADLDHRGGLPAVLAAFPVDAVWIPRGTGRDPGFAELLRSAARRGVPVHERGLGDAVRRVGDLAIRPLWPPAGPAPGSRNDASLVVRIEAAGRHLLFAGDLEAHGEGRLLTSGADLRAEVLKLPHHGSRSSSSHRFLAAVEASLVVASAPCAGRFGMPHAPVLARAAAVGSALWWTGRDGAVWVGLGEPLVAWGSGPPRACRGDGSGSR